MTSIPEQDGQPHAQAGRTISGWFVTMPLVTFCFLSIGAVALTQGVLQRRHLEASVALLLTPAVLALVAAPGYFYALVSHDRWAGLTPPVSAWIWVSLVVAALAAAGAIVASIPTGIGPVLSAWTLVLVIKLAMRFRHHRPSH
jgi:hypothetical protein